MNASQRVESAPGATSLSAGHAPWRILIVDDSATARAFAARVLRSAGHEVRTASDMWIATIVAEFVPDLILLDVHLGATFRGTTAACALRKRSSIGRNTRIVLHSSLPAAELEKLVEECGASGYICKQDDPDTLIDRVGAFLGEAR